MKLIPLRNKRGEVVAETLVDDEDYEEISKYRWHLSKGYALTTVRLDSSKSKQFSLHRELARLMCASIDKYQIDHIDCNRLNNQKSNLRLVTNKQNHENRPGAQRNSTTGIRGISYIKNRNYFQASVMHNKRHISKCFPCDEKLGPADVGALSLATEWVTKKRLELFTHNEKDRLL